VAHTQKTKGSPAHWTDRIGRRIKLRDLHILLAVAKAGSMGRAAAELAMSQPVVSKAIADLEHVLGVSLLDRSARGAEPTIYGRELLRCSVSVFDELRHGVEALQFLSDQSGGELHFGCTEGGAAGFVPAVIDALVAKYPQLRFNVETADPATLVERLRQREIEFAIGAAPDRTSDDIELDTLFNERFVVMAGQANPWTKKRNIALADLVGERWILQPPTSIAGIHAAAAFRACGLEPPLAQVTSFSVPLTHQLLTTGRYLALLAVAMAKLARHLPVRRLDVRFDGFPRTIAIMTLKNRTISPLARLFIERAHAVARPLRELR
jgi:DNA-binding transcriptional LysR family regulator